MLKRIEITNFESHKHTVLDGLSEGLNLIRGESNAGKTSIVRALKLAAYNDYDPKSLRTGETKCEVIVTTDKGTVKVVRGPKVNYWEVTPNGQPPLAFDKVGKNIIPEVARVLGLNIVRLGDADIPVNIMDQLESHFMLASLGGEDASGSLRAQVIDEISGLAGIEGVIKAVSLDNHRFGREIKENELKMQETQGQLHDENALAFEKDVLDTAETTLLEHDEFLKAQADAENLLAEYSKTADEARKTELALNSIPDCDVAKAHLETSEDWVDKANRATEIHVTAVNTQRQISDAVKRLAALPDVDAAAKLTELAKESVDVAIRMAKFLDEYQRVAHKTAELNGELETLEQLGDPTKLLEDAQTALEAARKAEDALEGIQALQDEIDALEGVLEVNSEALKKAEAERDAILAQVKVCPLTLAPVSPECLKARRTV